MTSSVMTRSSARVRLAQEAPEVLQRAVARMHAFVVGDVVAVVSKRRRIEGLEPDGGDAEALEVVELLVSPRKSPMPSPLLS